jgi:hypothetical protein
LKKTIGLIGSGYRLAPEFKNFSAIAEKFCARSARQSDGVKELVENW